MVVHDIAFVRRALSLLAAADAPCWLFGGWAEEVRGLCAARAHEDVDLLYPAEGFAVVDRLLADHELGLREIQGKRFAHKRALLLDGVMVEAFLVQRDDRGHFTTFWGRSRHAWPADALPWACGLPVASEAALSGYRARHGALRRSG